MKINELIRQNIEKLSRSERIVADKILNGEVKVLSHSITVAAKICGVSVSLINKFCIKIGASGWKTLKGLAFVSLRERKGGGLDIFSENYTLLENIIFEKRLTINKFLDDLYQKTSRAEKIMVFANGTTKHVADLVSHKWNKLGGNMVVYDYIESFIVIGSRTVVLYLSISGINKKIDYYQEQSRSHEQYLITFGQRLKFSGKELSLDVYENFGKLEKSFPVITDVFMHLILNKLIQIKLNQTENVKKMIEEININKL